MRNELQVAAEEWYEQTPEENRTAEFFGEYLQEKKIPFAGTDAENEVVELVEKIFENSQLRIKIAAQLLLDLGLDFQLTPLTADAIIRPRQMYEFEEMGYEFFLDTYHEHPWIEEAILKSIRTPFSLSIKPVYPADGGLAAYLMDPWNERVYEYSLNSDRQRRIRTLRTKRGPYRQIFGAQGVVTSSVGIRSKCEMIHDTSQFQKQLIKIRLAKRAAWAA